MTCFLCGKKIGLFRSLTDQQYCCTAHRKEARMASANAVREEEDVESWAVARSRRKNGQAQKAASPASQAGIVLAVLGIGAVMIGVLTLGGPVRAGGVAYPSVSLETGKKPGMLQRAGGALSDWVSGIAPVTLQHEFQGGVLSSASDWSSQVLRSSLDQIDDPRDWIGKTHTTASLRLWKKSTAMENYRMEFQAQIERTSLSWAVRATDAKNFHGTRLAIVKAGPLLNAGLIRFSVINGKEVDRTLNPLPLRLERGKDYRVMVTAEGNQINTYLNGQFLGRSITDEHLSRGGIGFFDDSNDPQKIAWVSVSERDSFLGRMLAHFALFIVPGEPLAFGE
jgi:hypothetical protein